MRGLNTLVSVALCAGLAGCAGGFTTVAPRPPAEYTALGHTEATACGNMFLLATLYNFIPYGLNDRVDRAYAQAVAKVPGARSLTRVSIDEDWYWWVLGTRRCTTVGGEAIK